MQKQSIMHSDLLAETVANRDMHARRGYVKSRTGCLQCKQRKIKCDEGKPCCRNCKLRKPSCSYLQYVPLARRPRHHQSLQQTHKPFQTIQGLPSALSRKPSPSKGLDSLPLQFTSLDLELLHFYATMTSNEILGQHLTGTHLWNSSLVTLSFKYPFLLHELFSLTALHLVFLHSSNPTLSQKYGHAATLHHMKCIVEFRSEVQIINRENSDACCSCAVLLGLHSWMTPDGQGANLFFSSDVASVAWYKLHRGGNEVIRSAFPWVEKEVSFDVERGVFLDMIRPWIIKRSHAIKSPLERVESAKLDGIASCWTETDLSTEDKLALEEALQMLREVFVLVSLKGIGLSASAPTFSWITSIPRRFCEMVEEKCPQALILVAVYCILWKRIEEHWWIRGKAENLLAAVRKELPDASWDKWLEWPLKEIRGSGTSWKD